MNRYAVPGGEGNEFEPGSNGKVLRNLLGITDEKQIETLESRNLVDAQRRFYRALDSDQSFAVKELCEMHRTWLGKIYPFAGKLRQVNIGKDGFQFASVQFLQSNLASFEAQFLKPLTPCHAESVAEVAEFIAIVHGEFIMLHPFREGNGRLGRWLADAMAVQAGLPFPRYAFTPDDANGYRAQYLSAVKRAVLTEYHDLSLFFAEAISRAYDDLPRGQSEHT